MRVGVAHALITPPPGIWLAGFSARKDPASGVHDDLYARAMVFEDRGRRLGLVVCDLCEINAAFVATVRERAQAQAGIPAAALMVAATHTHAAPATCPLYSQPPDPTWLAALPERTAGAVAEAADRLSPVVLTVAVGRETTIARNRRRPDGPVDPTVTVLRARRGDLMAAHVLHYACHPTVLGPENLLISRDYVGFAVDGLERATGGWAMFVNGACADVNVGHSADRSALGLPIPGRTFERAEALGLRLAVEAGRALQHARPAIVNAGRNRVLAAGRRLVEVPLRTTPHPEDARRVVASWRERVRALEQAGADADTRDAARLELLYADLALQWAEARGEAEVESAEVQGLAIGEVAFVALPGEFFAESGLRLKAESPFPWTIPVGYAGGGIGYVPPASAFAEGGYETRLTPWSRVAPEAEPRILSAAVDLLRVLRREQNAGTG